MDRPIFFDASGKRSRWSKRVVGALLTLIIAASIGFAWTMASVPVGRPIYPIGERIKARPLTEQVAHLRHRVSHWLPPVRPGVAKPVSMAFYVPWDPDSRVSLARQYIPDVAFHHIVGRAVHKPGIVFTTIDIACGAVAYWLDPRERRYPAHLLVAQRFIYRQLMYWVVLKAIGAALRGPSVGRGKLERSGRVASTA